MSQHNRTNSVREPEGKGHCVLRIPQEAMDEKLDMVTLPTSTKTRLFAKAANTSLPQTSKAREVLKSLTDIDPTLRDALGSKADALRDPPFRLYVPSPTSTTDLITSSYVALSYCWKTGVNSVGQNMHPYLPLTRELGHALLAERLSMREGIWVDQLCIAQDDPAEKAIAVATMDITYKSARLVVIAIEDVTLEENEAKVLLDISHQYDTLGAEFWRQIYAKPPEPLFMSTFWKLFSARWFTRAWCGHEYRVSGNRVLLLAVRRSGCNSICVLRISAVFLVFLSHLEAGYCSRYDQITYSSQKHEYRTYRARFCKSLFPHSIDADDSDTGRIASFMNAYLDVFSMDSLYVTDRLAIVLNVMNSGLYVKDGVERTRNECCRILSLVALVCKDPTVLTSRGPYLPLDERKAQIVVSWLQQPLLGDISEAIEEDGYGCGFRCLDQVPLADAREIDMDFYFLGTGKDGHYPSDIYLRQAEEFIEESIRREDSIWLLGGDHHPESEEAGRICSHFARVMACVIECGKKWVVNTDIVFNLPQRTVLLEQGLDTFFYKRNPSIGFGELMQSNSDELDTMHSFWNELCGVWLTDDKPGYLPTWFTLSDAEEDKVLMMCPREQHFQLVLPVLLQDDDYVLLNRFYFLDEVADEEDCWVAFAKTLGFGRPSIADERCRLRAQLRRGQRLRGRIED